MRCGQSTDVFLWYSFLTSKGSGRQWHPPLPVGLSQVKGLHSTGVPLQFLEALSVEIQVP